MAGILAVIGGSEAYTLMESGEIAGERILPPDTPYGQAQPVYSLQVSEHEVLFMSRHGEDGYDVAAPWVNYRANIWALKELGVGRIISWSGPGAIDETLNIGQFVVPSDVIDETRRRASSFFEGTGWGFVRQNPVFCPAMSQALIDVLEGLDLSPASGGVYLCTEGPRLETAAEIRKYRLLGGDMVGMTLVPEVFLARELEMCYASVCYITNYAEGIRTRTFTPGVLFEGLLDDAERQMVESAVHRFPEIIAKLAAVEFDEDNCTCSQLMERYRRLGRIGADWRTWVRQTEVK